jgi:hypothetical protein
MTRPRQTVLLDWRDSSHFRREAPCVLCQKPTMLHSHDGEPVHKICAEAWNAQHPGKARFVSDLQRRRRSKGDDHA